VRKKLQFLEMRGLKLCAIGLVVAIGLAMTGCPGIIGGDDARERPQPPSPTLTGAVRIGILGGGEAQYGATLYADTSRLDGSGQTSLVWRRQTASGAVTVGMEFVYTVQPADVNHIITLTATRAGYSGYRMYFMSIVLGQGTEGLVFVWTPAGYVVAGPGTVSGSVVIPPYHNGRPVVGIGEGAFQNNTNITSVIIPPGVRFIDDNAFRNTNIANVAFAGTSRLESIGQNAFRDSTNIGSFTIPESVGSVGGGAFHGWNHGQTIYIPFALDQADNMWGEDWRSGSNASIEEGGDITDPDPGPGYPDDPSVLTLRGQVWTVDWDDRFHTWSYFFNDIPWFVSSRLGGSGAITDGQLYFSIGAPHDFSLRNIRYVFDYFVGGDGDEDGGGNGNGEEAWPWRASETGGSPASRARGSQREAALSTFSDAGYWSDVRFSNPSAEFALLYGLSASAGRSWGSGWLSRWYEIDTGAMFSHRYVTYIFVDRDVTITGTGQTVTGWGGSVTFQDLNLVLETGWNAILVSETETAASGGAWNVTVAVSVDDPDDLRWELREEQWTEPPPPQDCTCDTFGACGGWACGGWNCECEYIPPVDVTIIVVTEIPSRYTHNEQLIWLLDPNTRQEVAHGWTSTHQGYPHWLVLFCVHTGDWYATYGAYYIRLNLFDAYDDVHRYYYSEYPKTLTTGLNHVALTDLVRYEHPLDGSIWIYGNAQLGHWLWLQIDWLNAGYHSIQWERETWEWSYVFEPIENANDNGYIVQEADIGRRIRVVVTSPGFSGYVAGGPIGPVPEPEPQPPSCGCTANDCGGGDCWGCGCEDIPSYDATTITVTGIPSRYTWHEQKISLLDPHTRYVIAQGWASTHPGSSWLAFDLSCIQTGAWYAAHGAYYVRLSLFDANSVWTFYYYSALPKTLTPGGNQLALTDFERYAPPFTGVILIDGTVQLGHSLWLGIYWTGGPPGEYYIQWERETLAWSGVFQPIEGATDYAYIVQEADIGRRIRAVVTHPYFSGYVAGEPVGPVPEAVEPPPDLVFTIDFDVPIETNIPGPTISMRDGPGSFPTITVSNPERFGNITWRMGAGPTLGQIGSVPGSAISGSHGETVALNSAVHGNRLGQHFITVEVTIGGVLHSRVITFHVTL